MTLSSMITSPLIIAGLIIVAPAILTFMAICAGLNWCRIRIRNHCKVYRLDEDNNIKWPKGAYKHRVLLSDGEVREQIDTVLCLAKEYGACPQIGRGYKMVHVQYPGGQIDVIPKFDSMILAFEDKTQAMLFKLAHGGA